VQVLSGFEHLEINAKKLVLDLVPEAGEETQEGGEELA
jgi:hypothetical protein